jgi:hypothetical protein
LAQVYWHCQFSADRPLTRIGEALKWPVGLERKAKEAKDFTKFDPIKALVWAAITNGNNNCFIRPRV